MRHIYFHFQTETTQTAQTASIIKITTQISSGKLVPFNLVVVLQQQLISLLVMGL